MTSPPSSTRCLCGWWTARRTTSDPATALADRQLLDQALAGLSPGHRAVVALHYLLGMPLPDVAQTLGIPIGTAKSRLHYALDAMRTTVDAEPETVPAQVAGGQLV